MRFSPALWYGGACQWAHCRPGRRIAETSSSSRCKATLEQLAWHRCLSSLAVWPADGRRAAHTRFRGNVGHMGANHLRPSARKSCLLRLPRLGPRQPAFTLPNPLCQTTQPPEPYPKAAFSIPLLPYPLSFSLRPALRLLPLCIRQCSTRPAHGNAAASHRGRFGGATLAHIHCLLPPCARCRGTFCALSIQPTHTDWQRMAGGVAEAMPVGARYCVLTFTA